MVTLKQIAKECGVTAATVSNVLNGKTKASEATRQKVLEVANRLGYRPNLMARGLLSQKSGIIGIIAEDIVQFTTPPIVEGIMRLCEEKGYRTVVANMRLYARWSDTWYGDENMYRSVLDPIFRELDAIMVDGVIYVAGHARHIRCFPESYRTPAVMTYSYAGNPRVPSILIDDENAACQIVRYLTQKGHRKIAIIAGMQNNIHTQARLRGAQTALFEAGIPFNPGWIQYANWDRAAGYEAAKKLLGTGATAVFCMSDRMAGGVYACAEEMGLVVGRDISVAGFDGQDISEYMIPQLTTMRIPLEDIGTMAARMLFEQIEQHVERDHEEVMVPCCFTERSSVADLTAVP